MCYLLHYHLFMQPEHDESAFNWIRRGRDEPERNNDTRHAAGYFLSLLMPPAFEAYAKILHRIEAHYEIIDNPLTPSETAILKIPPCGELRSLVENRRANAPRPRIWWKEVAEVLNVPFIPQINQKWYLGKLEEGCWPRFLSGPSDGWLCEEECGELVSVLNECTDGNDCFFRFSEWLLYGQGKPLFFRGSLDELNEFRKTSGYKIGPEYWWPRSRNWCVCSDYDHTFTIVGGSKELISTLLTNDILECLEVTPLTRIDYFVPMP